MVLDLSQENRIANIQEYLASLDYDEIHLQEERLHLEGLIRSAHVRRSDVLNGQSIRYKNRVTKQEESIDEAVAEIDLYIERLKTQESYLQQREWNHLLAVRQVSNLKDAQLMLDVRTSQIISQEGYELFELVEDDLEMAHKAVEEAQLALKQAQSAERAVYRTWLNQTDTLSAENKSLLIQWFVAHLLVPANQLRDDELM